MLSVATYRPLDPAAQLPLRPSMALHPLVSAAANGLFPDWAVVDPSRREHIVRVATLMGDWAEQLELAGTEQQRWRAAAYLHDALRDAPPAELREQLPAVGDIPDAILHGPAAAARLRAGGVRDEELLQAVAYHTIGDPGFGELGRALYAADFLEPGRTFLAERRTALRASAPDELATVVREVARERIRDQVGRGLPLHSRTVAFWNALLEESHE